MLFTGHHAHTIDSKGRLAIPADIRARWRTERDGAAWFALPTAEEIIRLFTETSFHRLAAEWDDTLTPDADQARLNSTLFGLAERSEMDAAGRIRLSEKLLKLVGIGNEVVLVGAGECLEIHNSEAWERSLKERVSQVSELARKIMERREQRARRAGGRGWNDGDN